MHRFQIVRAALAMVAVAATCTVAVVAQPAASTRVGFTAEELMAHVTTLAAPEMEGRRTGTPGNARAREWILQQIKAAGLEAIGNSHEHSFTFERKQQGATAAVRLSGVNLVGRCRGTGAKDGRAMVISAHYDHLGVRDGAVYHGADDNASGVAVLLALARQCRQTPWTHDALFAAFDAEELGLQGARAFVTAPPVPKDRIAINVNLDMVARGEKGELYLAGTSHSPSLKPVLLPVASSAKIKVLFGHDTGGGQNDWTSQSDHGAFHAAGIPFIYVGVEDHPDYHRPTDTADKINPGFFFQSAVTVLHVVSAIDRALPLSAGASAVRP